MTTQETTIAALEESFLEALEQPLDDVITALEGAFRRRAGAAKSTDDFDAFRTVANELRDLQQRDYTPVEEEENQRVN